MTTKPEFVKRCFSDELRRCCGSHYKTTPSNEQFARDFYLSSKYSLKVSRETVRKWFKGDTFPDLDHLLHLIKWLDLDMAKIFIKKSRLEENKVEDFYSQHPHLSFIESMTPEQLDFTAAFLNAVTRSDQVKR
ncbi:MAG: hypothetical protein J0651_03005, partial [Actinobacteria bacterium]|nr:hypothetical protein [Actinomycetota bacterium]